MRHRAKVNCLLAGIALGAAIPIPDCELKSYEGCGVVSMWTKAP
jgi:hypothetical protein